MGGWVGGCVCGCGHMGLWVAQRSFKSRASVSSAVAVTVTTAAATRGPAAHAVAVTVVILAVTRAGQQLMPLLPVFAPVVDADCWGKQQRHHWWRQQQQLWRWWDH